MAPSGLALAALLLLGFRVWFGILLGFFILDSSIYQLLPGAVIGLGETSEALFAAFLIHRLIQNPNILGRTRNVLFFVVAAVLAPIGNTTLGTGLLYLHGVVPAEAYVAV